jgi:hypothetical protein
MPGLALLLSALFLFQQMMIQRFRLFTGLHKFVKEASGLNILILQRLTAFRCIANLSGQAQMIRDNTFHLALMRSQKKESL